MVIVATLCGCGGGATPTRAPATDRAFNMQPAARIDYRSELTSLADTYMTVTVQGLEEVRATSKRPDVLLWTTKRRIGLAMASITNASNPSPTAGLLDMVVYARLERIAVEEHWAPSLLKDEAGPVVAAYRRGEQAAWDVATRNLTQDQLKQLERLVDDWRTANPQQFYMSHIRFSEFAKFRGVTADSPEVKLPGNLFGVFYMDPLAGIDPVVREARELRLLMERASYIALRMPIVLSWQMDLAAMSLTGTPELKKVADSTEVFAKATTDFSKSTADLVANLGTERKAALDQTATILATERAAAIDQIADRLENQRKGIVTDLNQQQKNMEALLRGVGDLVSQANQTVKIANAETVDTIGKTQRAAEATIDRVFIWVTALVIVLLIGIPLAAYANRAARRRQATASH